MYEFVDYLQVGVSVLSVLFAGACAIAYYASRIKAVKNAKTVEEKQVILNELKAATMGLITQAEQIFSHVPKSGESKLLYVLKEVDNLCREKGLTYDKDYWKEFISGAVGITNKVIADKKAVEEKESTIAMIKAEVPYFISQAAEYFRTISNSREYEIEHVIRQIEVACKEFSVNVFAEFDWRGYVTELYDKSEGVNE